MATRLASLSLLAGSHLHVVRYNSGSQMMIKAVKATRVLRNQASSFQPDGLTNSCSSSGAAAAAAAAAVAAAAAAAVRVGVKRTADATRAGSEQPAG
jgi:hypothetical protein